MFRTKIAVLALGFIPAASMLMASPATQADSTLTIHLRLYDYNTTLGEWIDCEGGNLTAEEIAACGVFPPVNLTVPLDPVTGQVVPFICFQDPSTPGTVVYPASCGSRCEECGYPDGCTPKTSTETQTKTPQQSSPPSCGSGGCYSQCGGVGPGTVSCSAPLPRTVAWDNLGYLACGSCGSAPPTTGVIHHFLDAPSTYYEYHTFRQGSDISGCRDHNGSGYQTNGDSGTFSADPCAGNPSTEQYGSGYWGIGIHGN